LACIWEIFVEAEVAQPIAHFCKQEDGLVVVTAEEYEQRQT
jgi:hypothetical protein